MGGLPWGGVVLSALAVCMVFFFLSLILVEKLLLESADVAACYPAWTLLPGLSPRYLNLFFYSILCLFSSFPFPLPL